MKQRTTPLEYRANFLIPMISSPMKIMASVLCQKFAKEVGALSSVMPAKAGIQLGTGYFFVFQKVAFPLSGWLAPGLRGGWPE